MVHIHRRVGYEARVRGKQRQLFRTIGSLDELRPGLLDVRSRTLTAPNVQTTWSERTGAFIHVAVRLPQDQCRTMRHERGYAGLCTKLLRNAPMALCEDSGSQGRSTKCQNNVAISNSHEQCSPKWSQNGAPVPPLQGTWHSSMYLIFAQRLLAPT